MACDRSSCQSPKGGSKVRAGDLTDKLGSSHKCCIKLPFESASGKNSAVFAWVHGSNIKKNTTLDSISRLLGLRGWVEKNVLAGWRCHA